MTNEPTALKCYDVTDRWGEITEHRQYCDDGCHVDAQEAIAAIAELAELRAAVASEQYKLEAANALLWILTTDQPNPMQLLFEDGGFCVAVCGIGDKKMTFIKGDVDKPYGTPTLSPEALAKVKALMHDDVDGDTRYWDEDVGGPYHGPMTRFLIAAAIRAQTTPHEKRGT